MLATYKLYIKLHKIKISKYCFIYFNSFCVIMKLFKNIQTLEKKINKKSYFLIKKTGLPKVKLSQFFFEKIGKS